MPTMSPATVALFSALLVLPFAIALALAIPPFDNDCFNGLSKFQLGDFMPKFDNFKMEIDPDKLDKNGKHTYHTGTFADGDGKYEVHHYSSHYHNGGEDKKPGDGQLEGLKIQDGSDGTTFGGY
ncbi:hypothetical protein JCM1840_000665 [Sporobolomyces johnsonii]